MSSGRIVEIVAAFPFISFGIGAWINVRKEKWPPSLRFTAAFFPPLCGALLLAGEPLLFFSALLFGIASIWIPAINRVPYTSGQPNDRGRKFLVGFSVTKALGFGISGTALLTWHFVPNCSYCDGLFAAGFVVMAWGYEVALFIVDPILRYLLRAMALVPLLLLFVASDRWETAWWLLSIPILWIVSFATPKPRELFPHQIVDR
jgi:hypothetical protein